MEQLKKLKEWLGLFNKTVGRFLPPNVKAIFQAIQIAFSAFILAYRAARDIQAARLKKNIDETAEKIQDPRLTFEERLKLNEEMENHYKGFVASVSAD